VAVDPSFVGRAYPPDEPYEVTRAEIAAFAEAVGATHPAHTDPQAARALGHPDVVAPPTWAVVVAQRSEAKHVQDPAAGVDFTRVVHADEGFAYTRPIHAGDRLVTTLHVDTVVERAGLGMVTTRVEVADEHGAPVATVTSTLAVRP